MRLRIPLAPRAARGHDTSDRWWLEPQAVEEDLAQLQEDYGHETFDRLLFASRRSNRVVVADVLRGSPAER